MSSDQKGYYAVTRGCTRCLMCYYECNTGAITIIADESAFIDKNKCIACGNCQKNCASEAIVFINGCNTAEK